MILKIAHNLEKIGKKKSVKKSSKKKTSIIQRIKDAWNKSNKNVDMSYMYPTATELATLQAGLGKDDKFQDMYDKLIQQKQLDAMGPQIGHINRLMTDTDGSYGRDFMQEQMGIKPHFTPIEQMLLRGSGKNGQIGPDALNRLAAMRNVSALQGNTPTPITQQDVLALNNLK